MPCKEIPSFFKSLALSEGMGTRTLKLSILNASRINKIINATWAEINFKDKLWIILAKRMESGKVYRIPLTGEALKLLQAHLDLTLD